LDRPFSPDELVHPRLSNLARAVGGRIGPMIVARRCAIDRYLKPNGRTILRWTQDHMQVPAVEPEHNLARSRFKFAALCPDLPRSAESPLVECEPDGRIVNLP